MPSPSQGNFLNKLSNVCSPTVTRVAAFLFAFGMIGLGIPFAAIVMRYNLLVGRVCGPGMSTFWAIYFPWLISWLFYTGGKSTIWTERPSAFSMPRTLRRPYS